MMYLILFESDPSSLPKDLKERMKIWESQLENIKKELDSGELAMIGLSPSGRNGFFISNQDAKVILGKTMMSSANMIKFEVKPMLSLDEVMDVMKSMQQ